MKGVGTETRRRRRYIDIDFVALHDSTLERNTIQEMKPRARARRARTGGQHSTIQCTPHYITITSHLERALGEHGLELGAVGGRHRRREVAELVRLRDVDALQGREGRRHPQSVR